LFLKIHKKDNGISLCIETNMGKKNTNDESNSEGSEPSDNLQEKNAVKEMSDNLKDARERLKALQEKSKNLRDKLKK
jgi:hypothetical protein